MFYKILKPIARTFCSIFFRVKIEGEENIPDGGYMICANHLSNWDPTILILFAKRKVHFLGKQELFKNPIVRYVVSKFGMIPIKRGQADMMAIKSAISILNKDKVLGIFPAGRRTKTLEDGQAKSGAALIGARCGCKAVPIYINSTYKIFSKVEIKIGKCIDLAEYKGKKLDSNELQELSYDIYHQIVLMSKK